CRHSPRRHRRRPPGAAAWDPAGSASLALLGAALAGQPARKEIERALTGERGCGRVVARPLIAVESVAGALVDVEDPLRVRRLQPVDLGERDALVGRAEVIEHRAPGRLVGLPRIAVIDDRAGDRQLASRAVGERSAPAVADGADTPRMPDDRDGGREVLQGLLGLQLLHIPPSLVHARAVIAQLYAATDAIEELRCDCGVALCRKAVGHGADVGVDAEDFLNHHDRTPGAGRRGGKVGLELVTVTGHEGREVAHGGNLFGWCGWGPSRIPPVPGALPVAAPGLKGRGPGWASTKPPGAILDGAKRRA